MQVAAPVALAMQAVGGLVQGQQQKRALNAQAGVDDENARLAELEGEQQALQTRKDERRQSGEMLTAMGGMGIQIGAGSAGDVLAEAAFQRELEVANIRTRANREATGLRQQAADRRKAAKAAVVNSVFGVAATALQGVSDLRDRRRASDAQPWNERTRRPSTPVPRITLGGRGA